MSQQVQKESIASTDIIESNFSCTIDVTILATDVKKSETQVVSLGHPKNESLEDFDKVIEQISEDSLENWKD